MSKKIPNTVISSTLILACGLLYSTPSNAEWRTFYQNAGTLCRGIDPANDLRLTRTANQLMNQGGENEAATVVCNLPSDIYAVSGSNFGVVNYASIWARKTTGSNKSVSCSMVDGFYGQSGGVIHTPDQGATVSLPNDGTQAVLSWTPTGTNRWLGPVNIRCILPVGTELNDMFVEYEH